jgi:phosphoenolpyruvate carboxykinase (GTP)
VPAAHPNARFTAPADQCPSISPEWEDPAGVPISAILFGGRRASNVPLVTEARSWQHGVFLGSIMSSETTAAQAGAVGKLRFDPFAMLPFCGYNMGDYFAHWLEIGEATDADKLPKLFWVNWFRKGEDGKFLWPGFGDNSRVVKWVLDRVAGRGEAVDTPIGLVPAVGALDVAGLDVDDATMAKLLAVDAEGWRQEISQLEEHYASIGERLPDELKDELRELEKRLAN